MQLFTAVVLAANAALVSAWCSPFSDPAKMYLYRQTGLKGGSTEVSSKDSCINIKGTWKSAKAAGSTNCRIYDTAGCKGVSYTVDFDGYKNPRFDIKAIKLIRNARALNGLDVEPDIPISSVVNINGFSFTAGSAFNIGTGVSRFDFFVPTSKSGRDDSSIGSEDDSSEEFHGLLLRLS
ncbi:hypothetical protein CONCODRAFT_3104 [Conidiobolus coronatus NRRL 28638]|uniref:Beta/gamma crystallin 'Greek key' domain-containing protein n=1 Tax=Conidiobolus coronatus (strain ATCC 28846 / CBS 209.66 / NRRL 28638) TaxID=796925 RepID=A0A137PFU1_CONC2|nr:hypothetical protein CONCODRAFT_3104 [Conidiobolus coronatus NRRL 28638]|eukprot:KXN73864.1 hypothetical protein CONCODRAFT_3104 [Conidiobolus coronatus NRRL 28638]